MPRGQAFGKIDVLKKVNRSEWAALTFLIPKKDHTVSFIINFRELKKQIMQKPFPIPIIQDMLLKLEGFQWARTSLDLECMGHYHIRLGHTSRSYCTTIVVLPTTLETRNPGCCFYLGPFVGLLPLSTKAVQFGLCGV